MRPDKNGAIARSRRWQSWNTLGLIPTGQKVPHDTLTRFLDYANETGTPIAWGEHAEDFVNDAEVSRSALGPEEFMIQTKWDFSDEDFWELTPPD